MNAPSVLLAQNVTNVEHVAVVAIVGAVMTIVAITASHIAVAEQSLQMENF